MVIVDRKEERASLTNEMIAQKQKICTECKTTKTPLWRVGPAGPKTLCNACGIKYRKRKVPPVKEQEKKRDLGQSDSAITSSASSSINPASTGGKGSVGGGSNFSFSSNTRLEALSEGFLLQRSPPIVKRQRFGKRKLAEEEQAAICLMALSSGHVFAWLTAPKMWWRAEWGPS